MPCKFELTYKLKSLKAQLISLENDKNNIYTQYDTKKISFTKWEKLDDLDDLDDLNDVITDVKENINKEVLHIMATQSEVIGDIENYIEVRHDPNVLIIRFSG